MQTPELLQLFGQDFNDGIQVPLYLLHKLDKQLELDRHEKLSGSRFKAQGTFESKFKPKNPGIHLPHVFATWLQGSLLIFEHLLTLGQSILFNIFVILFTNCTTDKEFLNPIYNWILLSTTPKIWGEIVMIGFTITEVERFETPPSTSLPLL